jgi:Flp pilus assembly protein TadG
MSTTSLQRKTSARALFEGPPRPDVPQRGWRSFASFVDDTAGDIAMMFGLMAMLMFMFFGVAVDMGRWINARNQTLEAIDAAVLAAGRALQMNSSDQAGAIAIAKQYYAANTKSRVKMASDTVTFTVTDNGTSVTASGNATLTTPFLHFLDWPQGGTKFSQMSLLNEAGADQSKAVLAVGGNAELNLEISMMLDTSGSMGDYTASGNPKYIDMRAAASSLVDIVVWKDQSKFTSRVAVVPFSGDVRLPATLYSKVIDPATPVTKSLYAYSKIYTYKKTSPCVAERYGNDKYTDAAPAAGSYITAEFTSNGGCVQSGSGDEIMPMSADPVALKAKINGLVPRGSTAGHEGTAWAYYMLSPKWASVVGSTSAAVAYNTPKTNKIAILMTDGEYNSEHDTNGITTGNSGSGASANGTASANQAVSICSQMKASGIVVYTVGFNMSAASTTAVNTLKSCASDSSKYYDAEDGEKLKQSFLDIALKISSLYLSK